MNQLILYRIVCALAILILGNVNVHAQQQEREVKAQRTHLIQVFANPEKFDGKLVRIRGWLCVPDDLRYGLYLTRQDCLEDHYSNAIQVEFDENEGPVIDKSAPKLVSITGTFASSVGKITIDTPFVWGRLHVSAVTDYD